MRRCLAPSHAAQATQDFYYTGERRVNLTHNDSTPEQGFSKGQLVFMVSVQSCTMPAAASKTELLSWRLSSAERNSAVATHSSGAS